MKILLATSELHPYSKTGGLADMVGSLGRALAQAGHKVGIVTPLYKGIRERFPEIERMDWNMDLPMGSRWIHGDVWTLQPAKRLTIYFVAQPDFFDHNELYVEKGADYPDNAERYIFFSKAVTQLARYLPWQPEILHLHDWQTGIVPLLVLDQKIRDGWFNIPRTCLTIHNLAYQSPFAAEKYALTNLPPEYFNINGAEFYGRLNCLKAGIAYADVITTVSPRFAREITTPEMGFGLDDLLRKRQGSLFGILNGVDYEEWNTSRNPSLPNSYTVTRPAGKAKNKAALQAELGLPVSATTPLFGCVSRLAEQKGPKIMLAALTEMLESKMQFVLLGSGDKEFEYGFSRLAGRYPQKAVVRIGFDQGLSHRIESGCDFFLMPSLFEPCGLNQMYSLRYGTVPVVRATGGLDDSVVDVSEDPQKADGIKFHEFSPRALAHAIRKAMALYAEPALLKHYRTNGMKADFSWDVAVRKYEKVYSGV
jgi:starch synthase